MLFSPEQNFITELPQHASVKEEKTHQLEEADSAEDVPDPALVNFTYEKVTKLLDIHTQLLDEPQKLQEKYDHLEKIGCDVSESITELKKAAETILNKAKK